ncbi:ABC transporter substrate-binding protein [Mesorhizobium sp. CO1-1-7]|uniref:ABC transporter substrate-binding protein n=1 Tax=unclassified Mesorhizobium TaxID=325217 RepID=UPI0011269D8B|nr:MULTISPECIES: ABC transporter substrate-binding protein [unclassified Mesorhizobium]MBZ9748245.1 ABC transporter substrate-binding protein [Mesorhizobium sp. CO1-1-7]TPJ12214.1 branched-chain amino acid ABC transporter substrate-binding protein [Mesorhizobium sp. B2-7-3]TPL99453.1 branched-chain amino acid ABC transporter substrate-binding protein [Mesorhizobium sp. B2-3-10]
MPIIDVPLGLPALGRMRLALTFLVLLALVAPGLGEPQTMVIGYLGEQRKPPLPLGPLDEVVTDDGLQGARLGIADNASTGRFLGQQFRLQEITLKPGEMPAEAVKEFAAAGISFLIADLDAARLLQASDAPGAERMTLFNSRAPDERLRQEDCRKNVLHTVPSRAMLADGLAQYLVWKRWQHWFLLVGAHPEDQAMAVAFRRAATRFGAEITIDQPWTFRPANGRADTGHVTLQTEIPAATQVSDYDVLVVADEADEFGAYLEGRTAFPRPVAGTQGLVATGWSAVNEEWGATQLQDRFHKQAGRWMLPSDYAAWLAVRSIGEAATRLHSLDPIAIGKYLRSNDFLLAGFKGQGLSFRPWDGQMRQPVLIAGPRLLVSSSPQPGFLHQRTPLDTLGIDLEESACRF